MFRKSLQYNQKICGAHALHCFRSRFNKNTICVNRFVRSELRHMSALSSSLNARSISTMMSTAITTATASFAFESAFKDKRSYDKTIDDLGGAQWKLYHEIGSGSYGVVYLSACDRTGGMDAVKVVKINNQHMPALNREISALRIFENNGGHDNIVSFKGVYQKDEQLHIVTEWMRGGELFEHLLRHGPLSEQQSKHLVHDICKALGFIHNCGIVHRDLKPENILMSTSDNTLHNTAKLADFGSAGPVTSFANNDEVGTLAYQPPEQLRSSISTCKSDTWALGCVLYIALCGSHPFDLDGTAADDVLEKRINSQQISFDFEPWLSISSQAKDLISCLLAKNPVDRLSVDQVQLHPWLASEREQLRTAPNLYPVQI